MITRRLFAEALGTAGLLAGVVGSGIMAQSLTEDIALALLANAIATGGVLYVLITTLGPVSGAHFNPAVTLAFLLNGELKLPVALAYVVVQIAGGVLGVVCAHAMFDQTLIQASTTTRTGAAQWLAEIVATFGLVFFIFASVRVRPQAVPTVVALYITAAYFFTASTSFANPAVTLARALTDTFAGIAPADAPGFIAAQIVGAILAAYSAIWLFAKVEPAASE